MRPIISIQNLSKVYRLGARSEPYLTLREELAKLALAPFRALRPSSTPPLLAALRNVSVDIYPGEVVGIVGRNGAGKSTLLKILSRITEPTSGTISLYGRVGSLLEVGTGFHPELTGRENIFLNGAILGMPHREITRRFDQIVAFAEVDGFLDTPVKHYSSGMYTKLAFSVAAHLESDILVVDEVLAVGDSAFQKKCLGRMKEVAGGGRTVLFVSHNPAAVESLCTRCLWLHQGRLALDGTAREVLSTYLTANAQPDSALVSLLTHPGRSRSSTPILRHLTLLNAQRLPTIVFQVGDSLGIQIDFTHDRPLFPVLGLVVKSITGAPLFGVNNRFIPAPAIPSSAVQGSITLWIDNLPLMPGRYFIDLYFGNEYRDIDVIQEAVAFDVEPADVFGTGQLCPPGGGPFCVGGRFEFQDTALTVPQ